MYAIRSYYASQSKTEKRIQLFLIIKIYLEHLWIGVSLGVGECYFFGTVETTLIILSEQSASYNFV